MSKRLTTRQGQVLTFIRKCINEDGYPPTVREIGAMFNFSEKAAHDHLSALEKKKYINRVAGKPRAISIPGRQIKEVPIVGRVAAGTPLLASENIEGSLPVPMRMVDNHECFALRIIGSSMLNAGILEGDYVIVRKQPDAEPGDIVVALIEEEATVKRFFIDGELVRLQPESPDPGHEASIVDVGDVLILGKVIGLHREM